ncbi:hypothetical protein L195_g027677 [Trifolium pratense]|uniref:Uncharacterized protein n=1 Tax=Trifolium pratense TaxID=57577 RepID=A0A2K3KZS9_TRIPR|nr:hypothetical protein L195_g027677 [Trifolium pratense]
MLAFVSRKLSMTDSKISAVGGGWQRANNLPYRPTYALPYLSMAPQSFTKLVRRKKPTTDICHGASMADIRQH